MCDEHKERKKSCPESKGIPEETIEQAFHWMEIILNYQEEIQKIKKETSNELCSNTINEVNELYPNNSHDTCGVWKHFWEFVI